MLVALLQQALTLRLSAKTTHHPASLLTYDVGMCLRARGKAKANGDSYGKNSLGKSRRQRISRGRRQTSHSLAPCPRTGRTSSRASRFVGGIRATLAKCRTANLHMFVLSRVAISLTLLGSTGISPIRRDRRSLDQQVRAPLLAALPRMIRQPPHPTRILRTPLGPQTSDQQLPHSTRRLQQGPFQHRGYHQRLRKPSALSSHQHLIPLHPFDSRGSS